MTKPKLSKLARAMPFAHFFGLAPSVEEQTSSDLDDERQRRDDETDDEYARRMEEIDEREEQARRAEEQRQRDEEAARARNENDVDGDDVDAEDDERDDGEATARAGRARSARDRERIRCAAIVAAGLKSGRVKQACVFAFDSRLTARQAVAALNAASLDAPAPQKPVKQANRTESHRTQLYDRMAQQSTPNPGASAAPAAADPSQALADRIVAAGQRVAR